MDPGLLGEIFAVVREGPLDRDGERAAFHTSLHISPEHMLLEKPHFGAFHHTGLELLLHRLGRETIIITGIETKLCCETTGREVLLRDFRVFFMSDATGTGGVPGRSREEVQRASLATVGRFFAQVLIQLTR
jgi:ureidoacrylate peracid hydrolase